MNAIRKPMAWGLVIISLLLLAGGVSAGEFAPWTFQTVDNGGKVGQYTSVALDPAGNPAISYYDQTYGDLKYASWDGSRWIITTVDCSRAEEKNRWHFWDWSHDRTADKEYISCFHGTERVGKYSSLAFDASGRPAISFYDESKGDLKYASWDGSRWIVTTVSSAGKVGEYSSLAFDASGRPAISFYDDSKDDLKYAAWDGRTWKVTTVDSTGRVGEYSSLVIDSANRPRISYYDESDSNLNYAAWDGTRWVITTVDGTKNRKGSDKLNFDRDYHRLDDKSRKVGKYSSLALDNTGNPRISYYDQTNKNLKFAAWNGTLWITSTVDSSKRTGEYTSLALDNADNPLISYYDATKKDLKFASWDSTASTWVIETVDSSGKVGSFCSLAVNDQGAPGISYYDESHKDLKYAAGTAHQQNPAPTVTSVTPDSGVAGSSVEVTITGTNFVTGTIPKIILKKSGVADIVAVDISVVSPTQITCTLPLPQSPASAGTWDLIVRNDDGQSGTLPSTFTVIAATADAPTVTGITPATGVSGTSVTITGIEGTGFLAGATVNLTKAGSPNIPASSVTVVSPTTLTCTIPLPAASATSGGSWNVVVTNPDGQSGTLNGGFSVTDPAPAVTAISPATGTAGSDVSLVTITGSDFIVGTTPSVSLTKTGQTPITAGDVVVVSTTQITCTLPTLPSLSASAGKWDVVVTNPDGQSGTLKNGFTLEYPTPTVISVIPSSGAAGSVVSVTITGTNFNYGPNPAIWLERTGESNINATDVHVYGKTQMSCTLTLPATATVGEWNIMVMNLDGQSASKIGAFTVIPATVSSQTWDWSVDGWGDWQHHASWTGTETGPCMEYGPVIEDGNGVHGSSVTLEEYSGSVESSVEKTFSAPAGTTYSSLTFSGLLSPVAFPSTRTMTITVNGVNVYSANADEDPVLNGQQFTITRSFTPAETVTVKITARQDPNLGNDTTAYITKFDTLTLSS